MEPGAIGDFDEIIDARSPAEFAEDHVPGAVNLPVLDNAERAEIGTLHKTSPFAARKAGAALVARNIARHLDNHFAGKPREYRPLVYCWRGGNRSGALVTVLRSVGWHATQMEGGYRAFRQTVVADLASLPERLDFRVVCGPTGVGKSRFLRALRRHGAQVLDLEDLAAHMGSVLGSDPERPQPGQKLFESRIWGELRQLSPNAPVYVESESRRIGRLHTPDRLLERMRAAPCLALTAPAALRIALLREEYAHFLADPQQLCAQLDCLAGLRGRATVERWQAMAVGGDWDALVGELLATHYDPAYLRSLGRNYPGSAGAPVFTLADTSETAFLALAEAVLDAPPAVASLEAGGEKTQ